MVNVSQDEIRNICQQLQLAYPDANRAMLSLPEFYQLIVKLPDYQAWPMPSDKQLQAMLWQWMRQVGEEAAC